MSKKNTASKKQSSSESEYDIYTVSHGLDSSMREYLMYLRKPWIILLNNFLVGMARGFGIIVGMTIIVAIFLFIINTLGGLPVIGDFFQWLGDKLSGASGSTSVPPYFTEK